MNRGARKEPIFTNEEHCRLFLDAIGDASRRANIEVHAYSLMPNHFHLLIRSPDGTLSRGMKYLLAAYTREVNKLHAWDGPIFRGRFKNQLVTRDDYLRHLVAYIHLNPVRAHLIDSPEQPGWTSHRAHLGLDGAPEWLAKWAMRQWFGSPRELAKWVSAVQIGRETVPDELDQASGMFRHTGVEEPPPVRTAEMPKIESVIGRVLRISGASPEVLRQATFGPRANPPRRFAALALLREGIGQGEIARELGMTAGAVSALAYRSKHRDSSPQVAAWLDALTTQEDPEDGKRKTRVRRSGPAA